MLYNQYIPRDIPFSRIPGDGPPPGRGNREPPPPGGAKGEKNAGIAGILKKLKLDDLDTGDILLLLILLLLFREGENTEIIIALGLVLLLSL